MAQHFICDFDGVLSNSLRVACEEVNRLREIRFPNLPKVFSQYDMSLLFCGPLRTSLRRFGLTDADSREFFDLHSAAMLRRSGDVSPFESVLDVVKTVAFGRATIVTSSYSDAAHRILARSEIYEPGIFSAILGREMRKPKSEKIADALRAAGVSVNDAIHVGDTVSDLLYSRDVSIPFCAVGWGYHPLGYLRSFDPDHSAEKPDDLKLVLQST